MMDEQHIPTRAEVRKNAWIAAYLNENDPETFFNGTGSARAAGHRGSDVYLCQVGCRYKKLFARKIRKWIDTHGLGDDALDGRLSQLLQSATVVFNRIEETDEHGNTKVRYERHVTPNDRLRLKALDMALKVRGRYAPEKKEIVNRSHDDWMDELDREEQEDPLAI